MPNNEDWNARRQSNLVRIHNQRLRHSENKKVGKVMWECEFWKFRCEGMLKSLKLLHLWPSKPSSSRTFSVITRAHRSTWRIVECTLTSLSFTGPLVILWVQTTGNVVISYKVDDLPIIFWVHWVLQNVIAKCLGQMVDQVGHADLFGDALNGLLISLTNNFRRLWHFILHKQHTIIS